MLLGASGTFYTYEYGGRRYTRYGSGIISITSDKSVNLSGSTNILDVVGQISQDVSLDADRHYQEILINTFVSESRPTSLIAGKQWNYKNSPHCNINFRRSFFDKHGYSRSVRNSNHDYLDEKFASRSFPQIPDNNQYYYGSGQTAYQNGQIVKIIRNKSPNKFFAGTIGNPPDDVFLSWGSGNISSSWELDYDGDEVTNRQYYLNTKKQILLNSNGTRDYSAQYGSAMDSIQNSNVLSGSLDHICGLFFNENFASGSGTPAYIDQYITASGSLSRSYNIGDYVQKEKGAEILRSWYVSGKSGSFELKVNNKELNISNELVTPNVGIIRSYYSNNVLTTASYGGITAVYCYAANPEDLIVKQLTCSLIINSCDCYVSRTVTGYYEYIINIKNPIIDEAYNSHESFSETRGFTAGVFLNSTIVPTQFWQIPLVNFGVDGNIKIVTSDKNMRLKFINTGKKWENDTQLKLSILCDFENYFIEISINDEYVCRIVDITKLIYSIMFNIEPAAINEAWLYSSYNPIFQIIWSWCGSIYTSDYDEYEIYTIRCVKKHRYWGSDLDFRGDARYKLINRNITNGGGYNGNLRKKTTGTLNFGIKLSNYDSKSETAVEISCSNSVVSDLNGRPLIYPIDIYNRKLQCLNKKEWEFYKGYFPATSGY